MGMPLFRAMAPASIRTTITACITALLTTLAPMPLPIAPKCSTVSDIASRIGLAKATSSSLPPIKNVVLPAAIPATPPAIAASTKLTLAAWHIACSSWATFGVTVLVSIISSGRISPANNSAVTALEISGLGKDNTTALARPAISATLSTHSSANAATTSRRSGLASKPRMGIFSDSAVANAEPALPSPTKPTGVSIISSFLRVSAFLESCFACLRVLSGSNN